MDARAKAILDSGKFDFKSDDSRILQDLQTKYSKEYLPFIGEIVNRADGSDSKLYALLELIQEVVRSLGKLLSGRLTGGTGQKLLKKVFNDLKEVEKGFAYVKTYMDGEGAVSEALKTVEEKAGISFNELTKKHKEVRKHVETIGPKEKSIFTGAGGALAEGFRPVAGVAGSLASAALGPFGELAMMGGKAVGGVAKAATGIGKRIFGSGKSKISEALMSTGANLPKATIPGAGAGIPGIPSTGTGMPTSPIRGGGKLTGQTLAQAATPLFYFFDRLALKATWTAKILDLVKKMAGDKKKVDLPWLTKLGMSGPAILSLAALLGSGSALVLGVVGLNKVINNVIDTLKLRFPKVGGAVSAGAKMMGTMIPGGIDPLGQLKVLKGDLSFIKENIKDWGNVNKLIFDAIKSTKLGKATGDIGKKAKSVFDVGVSEVAPVLGIQKGVSATSAPAANKEMVKEFVKIKEKESKSVKIQERKDAKTESQLKEIYVELKKQTKGVEKQTEELKPKKQTFVPPNTNEVAYTNKNTVLDGLNAGRMR